MSQRGSACRGRGWRGGHRGAWRGRYSWRGRGGGQSKKQPENTASDGLPPSKRPRLVQTTLSECPYKHWKTYLPNDSHQNSCTNMVRIFEEYFATYLTSYHGDDIDINRALPLDYNELMANADLLQRLPSILDDIKTRPELTLNCMGLALHSVWDKDFHDSPSEVVPAEEEDEITDSRRFHIRLFNHEPLTPLRSLRAQLYGQLVTVRGTVVRVSSIRPLVVRMAFQCSLCLEMFTVAFPDGKYTPPNECPNSECRGRILLPLRRSPLTQTIDWQTVRVQEMASDDRREAGRIPRSTDCELTADLVDACVPGDVVTVTAIVKATGSQDSARPRNSKDKCLFLIYLHAVAVVNLKASADGLAGVQEFSTKDYYAIQEIHGDSDVFRLLVGSLCPTVYGHEMVKAGLILGLFGGRQGLTDGSESLATRGSPHILVVGDPGLGKSQMLQAASSIAPRGVYVCGNTTTMSGLTVTLVKEGGTGEYSLEAGALVLGDQGCCCIDEFDKMGNQHQVLLEAMEQQSISIAKAGIVCSLPARTSILAAANPVGGHYNKGRTVSENLKMSGALLSRFDLVFILLDKPDEEMDCLLSEHVMSLHSGRKKALTSVTARRPGPSSESILLLGEEDGERLPLTDRLRIPHGTLLDPVPVHLLRKYIGYAQRYVQPRLDEGAGKVLREFYLQLRKERQDRDHTPITTRQLESLIRLTEARARVELREDANEGDAKDVVELMKYSMLDTFSDEFGALDFQRSQHGSGMSQRAQAKRFITELGRISERTACCRFTVTQLKETAKHIGLQVKSLEDFISSLNNQGYLLKKGAQTYQLQTSSCL